MEKFIVSARKYRPQNFATVVGQQHITTTLKNAIQHNTLAHAFLFCGPRGVGKTTCARILAKTINCENLQTDGEACNECHSCVSFNNGTSLNIHELDAASNNSVDDIRELVTQIRFAPQEGKYKIYIIDEVHMLSSNAFNAFLKTLEEPPSYVKFVLATTEKHKILPTILSRCQIFDFKRITNADTVDHLLEIVEKEGTKADKAALHLIAQKSEGCMRDALSMLDKIVSFTGGQLTYANTLEHLNLLDEDYFFKLLEALLAEDLASSLLLYDEINRKGFEGDAVLNGFSEFIRNLMMCKDDKAAKLLDVLEGMQEKYAEFAKKISLSFFVSALNVLGLSEAGFRTARNKRLHVELCLIKLCYLQQAIALQVSAEGQVVVKKSANRPIAIRRMAVEPIVLKPIQPKTEATDTPKLIIQPLQNIPVEPLEKSTLPTTKITVAPIAEIPQPQADVAKENGTKKASLLDSFKNQQLQNTGRQAISDKIPITEEALAELWESYIEKLKTEHKHSTITSFQMAKLSVGPEEIFIKSLTLFNHKSIEAEFIALLSLLKSTFHNPDVTVNLLVEDDGSDPKAVEPKHLNSHERYRLMTSDYPLVKSLKERLKMELKY